MDSLERDRVLRKETSYVDEDILVQKLFLSHDPDGRRFDSEMLLQEVENAIHYVTAPEVSHSREDSSSDSSISNIEVVGSSESLPYAISKTSIQMLCANSGEKDLHTRTMILVDLLENYKWDAKVVLALAALATTLGRFWLLKQLSSSNPLAASVAVLNRFPFYASKSKPRFKALRLLVKSMVDLAKCIIKFEGLPIRKVKPDSKIVAETKPRICVAAYWVVRSALACSSQITEIRALKPEGSDSTMATCELSSLGYRLSRLQTDLTKLVDECRQVIEEETYQKLLNLFKESHEDNQEILQTLFALKDDFPFKDCSRQLGVSDLKNKVVILLISNPELLPLESLLLLVHQTFDHPSNTNVAEHYQIVWVPIPTSPKWTDEDERIFDFLSNSLPWWSVRQPWLLNSAVVRFLRTEWNYRDGETMMVVLGENGEVLNFNAIDMVFIWGARAFPFSVSREDEIWQEDGWSMLLLLDGIHPILTKWMEEGRDICVYGSNDHDWIGRFTTRAKEIQGLELVYVGKRNPDEHTRTILSSTNRDFHITNPLSFTKLQYFWLRLESIRRSKLNRAKRADTDNVLREVSDILDFHNHENNWAVFGKGMSSYMVKMQGEKPMECLGRVLRWRKENAVEMSFLEAVKIAGEEVPAAREPCDHTRIVGFGEGLVERGVTCEKCKRPMKKFIFYK